MPSLLLLPLPSGGPVQEESYSSLRSDLERVFRLPSVLARSPLADLSFAYDSSRNQYYSTALLSSILEIYPKYDGKILAVTSMDLYVPVLTYVFGEAQLDGTAAIVSTYRLHESLYGLPEDDTLYRERVVKECVHELGHTFGLVHCHNFECVMHSSSAVEEVDLKKAEFCERCEGMLGLNPPSQ
ncbi:MAG: archaemetzincin family Zn-dependent metalloprotease [Bacteroidota bacterium]